MRVGRERQRYLNRRSRERNRRLVFHIDALTNATADVQAVSKVIYDAAHNGIPPTLEIQMRSLTALVIDSGMGRIA